MSCRRTRREDGIDTLLVEHSAHDMGDIASPPEVVR
jgi:hypothetical protein